MDAAGWIRFLLFGWGSTFSAYVLLQTLALGSLRRPFLYASLLPLPFMVAILAVSLTNLRDGGNLWPLWLIFVSPIAVVYLLSIEVAGLRRQPHPDRGTLTFVAWAIALGACLPYVFMFVGAG
jgi:FtsH-binding integral membrane protein